MTRTLQAIATDRLLIAFGFVKLLLVFAFFASFGLIPDANAQTGDACKGTDLLAKLEREDSDAHARVIAEAAKEINTGSLLWKVEKKDQPVSYLFGTMHLADPDVSTLSETVKDAIAQSEIVVVESTDALDPQKTQAAMGQVLHLTMLPEGKLTDFVADDLEDELAEAVTLRGVPMEVAERMQPWLIATMISLTPCEMQRKQSGAPVLDAAVAAYGMEQSKEIAGLETVAEQLQAIASLPVEYHVSALEETLATGGLATDMSHTLKNIYLSQDMGLVFPLMKEVMPGSAKGEGTVQFQEVLIHKRNRTMAERLVPMIRDKPAFVAVGALHLPGETGLVRLLREAGYSVTAMR